MCVWEGERERGDREHERGGEEGSIPTLPPLLMCVCVCEHVCACVLCCVCVYARTRREKVKGKREMESV